MPTGRKPKQKTAWQIYKKFGAFPGDFWDEFKNEKAAQRVLKESYDSDLKTFRIVKVTYDEVK